MRLPALPTGPWERCPARENEVASRGDLRMRNRAAMPVQEPVAEPERVPADDAIVMVGRRSEEDEKVRFSMEFLKVSGGEWRRYGGVYWSLIVRRHRYLAPVRINGWFPLSPPKS